MPIKDLNELREEIVPLLKELQKHMKVDKDGIPRFSEDSIDIMNKLKDTVIKFFIGNQLSEAQQWLEAVRKEVQELVENLKLNGFTYPREFNSFILDPQAHMRKKLFNYAYDAARGKISVDEFLRKAAAALRTSLRTNLRTAYQIWSIAAVMNVLHNEMGYELEYPEHRFLNFDRSGKQRLGIIPPNAVLINYARGYLSFFHEAPRPLGWEDTSDLQKVWSLYIALRPDLLVYSGKVMNIVNIPNTPPIKRPNVLIEFKELPDWYMRVRDLKGYFKKPITAEEWRSKWLEGLFDGLADIMGVKRSEVKKRVEEGASLRVREYKLIALYVSTYKPDVAVLVSKHELPSDIKSDLESKGIVVLDSVGFDRRKLKPLAELLNAKATYGCVDRVSVSIRVSLLRKLMNICAKMGLNSENFEECLERVLGIIDRVTAS